MWYNWEVELPELAYRLDVDEMEDGGVSRPSPGFLAVRSGYFQLQGEGTTEEDKVSGDKCNLRCIGGGFETLKNCQVGKWVPESVVQGRSGLESHVCVLSPEEAVGTTCTERTAPFGHQFSHSPVRFLYPISYVCQAPSSQMPMGLSRFPDLPLSQGLPGHWEVTPSSLCSSGAVRCLTHSWSRITGKSHSCGLLYFRKCMIILFGGR